MTILQLSHLRFKFYLGLNSSKMHVQYFKANVCLHAVENSNILSWNERLNIAVDTAHGNVLFMASYFLHFAPLHFP